MNVNPLYGEGESLSYSSGRPVLSVALNPDFYRQNTKEYVCGGKSGDLILNKKGIFILFRSIFGIIITIITTTIIITVRVIKYYNHNDNKNNKSLLKEYY